MRPRRSRSSSASLGRFGPSPKSRRAHGGKPSRGKPRSEAGNYSARNTGPGSCSVLNLVPGGTRAYRVAYRQIEFGHDTWLTYYRDDDRLARPGSRRSTRVRPADLRATRRPWLSCGSGRRATTQRRAEWAVRSRIARSSLKLPLMPRPLRLRVRHRGPDRRLRSPEGSVHGEVVAAAAGTKSPALIAPLHVPLTPAGDRSAERSRLTP